MADTDQNDCNRPENEDSFPPLTAEQSIEAVGTKIGRYKLLSVLGEGGFGMVYLAEQERPLKRRVALKVIKPGMDTKQVIARFEAERQALALLDHPNIAHVFDAGTTDTGRPYFVMELVQGLSIIEYCDRHKLSIEQRLNLFIEVCEAVQYAHQKGIIHRDLKPSNIMVSVREDKAIPVVIDFGVAKAMSQSLTERTLFTEQGQFIGTPEYMSPEQAEMTTEQIDARSDIYSLGVVLYELLSGTLPFEAQTLREGGITGIRNIIRHEDPKTPSTRLSGLGDQASKIAECRQTDVRTLSRSLKRELEWIPLKAMRKEPDRRYRTVSDLADDIRNYLQGNPLEAGPESVVYRTRKLVHRHAIPLATVTAFLILLVAALITSITLYSQPQRARAIAEAATVRAQDAENTANEQRMAAEKAELQARKEKDKAERAMYAQTISSAARHLEAGDIRSAWVLLTQCASRLRGWEWDFLKQKASAFGSPLPIFCQTRGGVNPVISANGQRILANSIVSVAGPPSGAAQTEVSVWDVNTVSRVAMLPWRKYHESSRLDLGTISPGGNRVALAGEDVPKNRSTDSSVSADTRISIWDVTDSTYVTTIRQSGQCVSLAFSPDGKRIVSHNLVRRSTGPGYEGTVKIWDADSGSEIRTLTDANDLTRALAYSPDDTKILRISDRSGLTVWTSSGQLIRNLSSDAQGVFYYAAWHPDSRKVACAGSDSVTIYDINSGSRLQALPSETIRGTMAFSPDGHLLAWTNYAGTVAVNSLETGKPVFQVRGHDNLVQSVAFTEDGRHVMSVDHEIAYRWDLYSDKHSSEPVFGYLPPQQDYLVSLGPNRECIVTDTKDQIRLYRTGVQEPLRVFDVNAPEFYYYPSQLSHNGKYIARVDPTDEFWTTVVLRVWEVATGQVVFSRATKPFPLDHIFGLSPDGCLIALIEPNEPEKIAVYDALENVRTATHSIEKSDGFRSRIESVAFSPDAKHLVVQISGKIQLFDMILGKPGEAIEASERVWNTRFSPDGRYLLAEGIKSVEIFELDPARRVGTHPFVGGMRNTDFWADHDETWCRLLCVPTHDRRSIELWDVISGVKMFSLEAEVDIEYAAFTEDGRGIMAVCEGGKVLNWRTRSEDSVAVPATDSYVCGVAYFQNRDYELSVSAFTECIALDSSHLNAYRFRGVAHSLLAGREPVDQAEMDLAISDLLKVLELETDSLRKRDTLADLGHSYSRANRLKEAGAYLEGFLSEIGHDLKTYAADFIDVGHELATVYAKSGQHEKATAIYSEMLGVVASFNADTISPETRVARFTPTMGTRPLLTMTSLFINELPDLYRESNDPVHEKEVRLALLESDCLELLSLADKHKHMKRVAWICATSPDPAVRNGKLAVKHAVRAWELLSEDQDASNGEGWWLPADYARTVAAAHAEAGDFKAAVEWELEAMELWGGREKVEEKHGPKHERLELYRQGKPWRDDPRKPGRE